MTDLLPRMVEPLVESSLDVFRVTVLTGARQVGKRKSTLGRKVVAGRGGSERTLDDETTLALAQDDPTTFVTGARPMPVDEIQRAPKLALAVKVAVDRDRLSALPGPRTE